MTDLLDEDLSTVINEDVPPPGADGEAAERRTQRLLSGLSDLSTRVRTGGIDGERLLFILGAVAAPLGMLLIGIGWYGSAGSGLVFEQIPYVVSGGIAGLGFVFIGCTLYACWWITRSIREQRERHDVVVQKQDELIAAVREMSQELANLRETPRRR
jgi:hypothetical protein